MKIHPAEQGSTAWHQARAGVPTASEMHNLLTPQFKLKAGEAPKSYVASKVAEAWLGGPLFGSGGWATEQGHLREEKAIPWYEMEHDTTIQRVGFITTDDNSAGCSPDGLLGEDGGIEIKCPEPTKHVAYVVGDRVPDEYVVQVHAGMFVTGRAWWKFLSYRRGFPPLLLTVERDGAIQGKILEALDAFHAAFGIWMDHLTKANGGKRPKPKPYKEADWITCPVEQLKTP